MQNNDDVDSGGGAVLCLAPSMRSLASLLFCCSKRVSVTSSSFENTCVDYEPKGGNIASCSLAWTVPKAGQSGLSSTTLTFCALQLRSTRVSRVLFNSSTSFFRALFSSQSRPVPEQVSLNTDASPVKVEIGS